MNVDWKSLFIRTWSNINEYVKKYAVVNNITRDEPRLQRLTATDPNIKLPGTDERLVWMNLHSLDTRKPSFKMNAQ